MERKMFYFIRIHSIPHFTQCIHIIILVFPVVIVICDLTSATDNVTITLNLQ